MKNTKNYNIAMVRYYKFLGLLAAIVSTVLTAIYFNKAINMFFLENISTNHKVINGSLFIFAIVVIISFIGTMFCIVECMKEAERER